MARSVDIDAYIAALPPKVQTIFRKLRATIRKAVPRTEEKISYRMPAFVLNGRILIYYAAFKNHIGIYPPIRGDEKLGKQLARYKGPKGNLKFPLDELIPSDLIAKLAKVRAKQLAAK
jgi:uncharacterized protein YdhG (YjbR/CyaY superfamily)